jgi:hypothetical protein
MIKQKDIETRTIRIVRPVESAEEGQGSNSSDKTVILKAIEDGTVRSQGSAKTRGNGFAKGQKEPYSEPCRITQFAAGATKSLLDELESKIQEIEGETYNFTFNKITGEKLKHLLTCRENERFYLSNLGCGEEKFRYNGLVHRLHHAARYAEFYDNALKNACADGREVSDGCFHPKIENRMRLQAKVAALSALKEKYSSNDKEKYDLVVAGVEKEVYASDDWELIKSFQDRTGRIPEKKKLELDACKKEKEKKSWFSRYAGKAAAFAAGAAVAVAAAIGYQHYNKSNHANRGENSPGVELSLGLQEENVSNAPARGLDIGLYSGEHNYSRFERDLSFKLHGD